MKSTAVARVAAVGPLTGNDNKLRPFRMVVGMHALAVQLGAMAKLAALLVSPDPAEVLPDVYGRVGLLGLRASPVLRRRWQARR